MAPAAWARVWRLGGGDPQTPFAASFIAASRRFCRLAQHDRTGWNGSYDLTWFSVSTGDGTDTACQLICLYKPSACTVFITAGSSVCLENSVSRRSEVLGRRQDSDSVDSGMSLIETSSIQLNRLLSRHLKSKQEFSTEHLLCAGHRAEMYRVLRSC